VIDKGNHYVDCEFTDPNGIAYLVFGYSVVRKEIRLEQTSVGPSLPFGLKFSDSVFDAVKILTAKDHADFPIGYVDLVANAGDCQRNASGQVFDFYLVFGKEDHLRALGVRTD
jgi:hypothetical protein